MFKFRQLDSEVCTVLQYLVQVGRIPDESPSQAPLQHHDQCDSDHGSGPYHEIPVRTTIQLAVKSLSDCQWQAAGRGACSIAARISRLDWELGCFKNGAMAISGLPARAAGATGSEAPP